MIQEERKTTFKDSSSTIQNLILENREKLTISGVIDVLSFDDQIVILENRTRHAYNKRRRFKNKQT